MNKVYAYGMDGLITPMVKYFAREGSLPNFQRMLDKGSVNQTAPSFPVWTPTNWATLSTGAHTGTHGVTRWRVELEGGERISSFRGEAVSAQRIWNALERSGQASVAVHYPAADPSGVKNGFVVDGYGHPGYASTDYEIAAAQAYTTSEGTAEIAMDHDGTAVRRTQLGVQPIPRLAPAVDWTNLPDSRSQPMETAIEIHARIGEDVTTLHVLALDGNGEGYDRVQIFSSKNGRSKLTEVAVDGWSEWVTDEFAIDGGVQRASVRFKLMKLTPAGKVMKLYRTQVTYATGFTYPDDLAEELTERFGPYQEHASMTPYTDGMADFDTALEECEYQGLWFAQVANYMLKEKGCSLFMCHWHLYDYLNHIHLNDVDPVCPAYEESKAEAVMDLFRRAYQDG